MRASLTTVAIATALLAGCSDGPPRELPVLGEQSAPIVNGSVENSGQYEAVVAVFGNMSKCTGTIVGVQVPYAFVLTAAHCVTGGAPQVVRQGVDHDNPTAEYPVQDYAIHPGYNQSVNDFAMIRVTGASASTPVRQVLTSAEDNLGAGTTCTHVGYGNVAPGTGTNLRHITTNPVISTTSLTITFNGSSSGVCYGDSGGPNFHPNGKVAGVNSAVSGNNPCAAESFSGRASAVLDTFIIPFINNSPPPPVDCDGCFEAATTGTGSCISAVNACFGNSTCNSLVACFNSCTTQQCVNQCASTYSGGVDLYNGIFDCVCDSACSTECATASMCTDPTPPPTTSSVAQSSVAADASSAAATTGAGGAGAGGAGAGGAATTGTGQSDGFYAGNEENLDPDGILVGSTCAFDEGPSDGDGYAWLLLAAGVAARRRRSAVA